jgi:hypothetical protein
MPALSDDEAILHQHAAYPGIGMGGGEALSCEFKGAGHVAVVGL